MISPLIIYRAAHWLDRCGVRIVPTILTRINYFLTGCDIAPRTRIGQRVHFQHHGSGVVIHQSVEIGDDVWIMPQVVLGQDLRHGLHIPGMRIKIGKGAMLGAGCKVIARGLIEVGAGASIGANAVVLTSVPDGETAVGVPARVKRKIQK